MIEKANIEQLVKKKIEGTDLYLVEVKVDVHNNVYVFVDSMTGVSIDACIEISRFIDESVDREIEDYALEVSSPGIGGAFKVYEQYQKVFGKTVEVVLKSGLKFEGTLVELNDRNFTVQYLKKEKPEGAKRPLMVEKKQTIDFTDVKSTKEIITF